MVNRKMEIGSSSRVNWKDFRVNNKCFVAKVDLRTTTDFVSTHYVRLGKDISRYVSNNKKN